MLRGWVGVDSWKAPFRSIVSGSALWNRKQFQQLGAPSLPPPITLISVHLTYSGRGLLPHQTGGRGAVLYHEWLSIGGRVERKLNMSSTIWWLSCLPMSARSAFYSFHWRKNKDLEEGSSEEVRSGITSAKAHRKGLNIKLCHLWREFSWRW